MTEYFPFYPQYVGPRQPKVEPKERTPLMRGEGGEIMREVARAYRVSVKELVGPYRDRRITWPRQELMWRLHQTGRYSLTQIGEFLGGRDHSTVLHGVRQHEKRMGAAR